MRIIQIALRDDSDVLQLRRRTKEIAVLAGIRDQEIVKFVTAVSEIARNALQYAKSGVAQIEITTGGDAQYLTVQVIDKGSGISNLQTILDGRYVSQTGLGKGLLGSKKLVDLFDVQTGTEGTRVTLSKAIAHATPRQISEWAGSLEVSPDLNALDEMQKQNQELMAALSAAETLRQAVEKANQHKSDFLANMSHEIRTPMNAIVGITNILWRSDLSEEQRLLMHGLKDAGNSLLVIINDILDLSKIEAGKLQIDIVPFNPIDTTYSVTSLMKTTADEKGLLLITIVDKSAPTQVLGDHMRYRQVLLNLVSNALKYTRSGEVLVYLTGDENASYRCTVCDTGVGMSAADLERAFEQFEQLEEEDRRGTGLGLPIVKSLVELMKGSLWADSRKDTGSAFTLTLPCDASASASEQGSGEKSCNTHEPGSRLYKQDKQNESLTMYLTALGWAPLTDSGSAAVAEFNIKDKSIALNFVGSKFELPLPVTPVILADTLTVNPVRQYPVHLLAEEIDSQAFVSAAAAIKALLVEDHPVNQLVMTTELRDRGIDVVVAASGTEAVQAARKETYDVILMDCQLADIDGYEVTRRIREFEDKSGRRTPIIAVTAYAMQGDRERCLAAGMDDYLSKPVQMHELMRALERWTGVALQVKADNQSNEKEKVATKNAKPVKTKATSSNSKSGRSAESKKGIVEPASTGNAKTINLEALARRYKPASATELLKVFVEEADGTMVSMRKAIKTNSFGEIARNMHGMRGACNVVFAGRMAGLCGSLETAATANDSQAIAQLFEELEQLYGDLTEFIESQALPRFRGGDHPG